MIWRYFLLLFLSLPTWSKSTVLISYYNPFSGAKENNSEKIAYLLKRQFLSSNINIELCVLETVFDKSYLLLEKCYKKFKDNVVMVLGLGEYGCKLKVETMAKNYDSTTGPDNDGNEREGEIILGSPFVQALRYPLPEMYCGLSKKEKSELTISRDSGSFVCNNTAYQFSYFYPEAQFGFVHVPSHNCWFLEKKNKLISEILGKMITSGVNFLKKDFLDIPIIPHPSNHHRLPVLKSERNWLKNIFKKNSCYDEYLNRAPVIDE